MRPDHSQAKVLLLILYMLVFYSCTSDKKTYTSNCNDHMAFKRVGFAKLIADIKKYDQQYVEVTGIYREAKGQSGLFNDSLFVEHSASHALWVNFNQDCPLYLFGTRTGLFEYNNGRFTQLNNRKMTLRGRVDVLHKGHTGSYRATIDRVSFVKL
jgi:hypothetical protein